MHVITRYHPRAEGKPLWYDSATSRRSLTAAFTLGVIPPRGRRSGPSPRYNADLRGHGPLLRHQSGFTPRVSTPIPVKKQKDVGFGGYETRSTEVLRFMRYDN